MTDETGLVQYDAMRQALQCCARIDEVKDIHDKAKAMELYALQTKDKEMETWVAEIKQRAKLRMGELARELQTSNGGQSTHVDSTLSTTRKSTKGQAIRDAGLSITTAHSYETLAGPADAVAASTAAAVQGRR